ncbi:T7SS effector LXG polymorphic toxin [Peribacillus frigoritolerans]|uniref:T7SS effector LXG polymorphic toxin n=1 Tax=Peribacillus frigoritolerans TaxID=450367 RepID=UPI00207985E0|nr:T7SS effector LXG polymorphic toxin [Peribacillus frigoritolerans]USK74069.1 AHH domain-containing protein [Peribacillus frigoritolerans]
MSMIYESQTLVSAMQTRVGQYKDLKEQLTELRKGFESIVHLDDELQGQGAEAIKGFYKAQIDVVDSWLRLINRHVAFLSGIQGDTIEANLSETVVTVPFLEEELTNATRNSKEMVTAQKDDLKKILAGIDDIIQLEPFSDDAFFENMEKAERKRTETVDKVNEIDHKWTAEYAKSEADQAAVAALMEQLKVSSTRGGVVSPLYFNAAAYKNSEAYKNLEVRKKETAQYLKVKQEEAENRRIKDLKAQLDHVTDPDEFLKIAKQIGYENLAPTQQQYVMQLEAAKQTADIAKGIGVGLYDVGKDFVTGVWDFVTDPGGTVEGVANSIMHPIKTYKYISKSISDSYERDMVNGDAYSRAHWVSYALGTVVTSVVGTKGAGAVAKTGAATTKAAAVKGATKAKELASIPNLLPYNPKNQLSLAGGVPYNVVNGTGLKEQLISMAKVESEVSGRGIDKSNRLIPGNPGVITGGNSNKLGKNMMEVMGLKRSTKWSGYQAQHIIPSEMAKNAVIQKIGMNFDDSSNGIFLRVPDNDISTMSRHRGYHSVYNEVVERALNKMDINQSVNSLQKDVYELKNNLRKLQENGLPLYPSQGATVELWERKLKQLENK